jgi:hypothetical protein
MKLYLVHCGFYDNELCDGVYEGHVSFFVVAEGFEDARARAKQLPEFKARRMHVDGLQEIAAVGGYRLTLEADRSLQGKTVLTSDRHRDLASKTQPVLPASAP